MEKRDLLLLIGFLRGGKMFPVAVAQRGLPVERSLRLLYDAIIEQERGLFPGLDVGLPPAAPYPGPARPAPSPPLPPARPGPRRTSSSQSLLAIPSPAHEDVRRRSAVTTWSGDFLMWTSRIGEVPDPGVVLCLMYEGPAADAALPIDVFAQTLRRYALREPTIRASFDAHVQEAGTYVPPWLSPEVRRQRSQEAYDRAMLVASEHGFAAATPLLEGVRGDCYAPAQIALALHELRELGDAEGALSRLDEVLRVAPRNVAARLARARILVEDAGRKVEAAADWLAVLRELGPQDGGSPPGPTSAMPGSVAHDSRVEARNGLWALCREFANSRKLEAAAAIVHRDPERGFEAVSRYVHTHPCSWDGQLLLASLSLARQSFELTAKLLGDVRWLYPEDPNPHFVYGQALASKGNVEGALPALEYAARLSPGDGEIARWLSFARDRLRGEATATPAMGIKVAHQLVRSLLLLVGFVRGGRVHPAALTLHRVPGDVSLALVVQALAGQERRRFGADGVPPSSGRTPDSGQPSADDAEIDLAAAAARAVLLDQRGRLLHTEQLVGDVPDPGVVLALLYEPSAMTEAPRPLLQGIPPAPPSRSTASGRPTPHPPPAECHRILTALAQADTEIAAKLTRHLESPDATLMGRLDLVD